MRLRAKPAQGAGRQQATSRLAPFAATTASAPALVLADGFLIAPLLARQKWLRHAFGTRLAAGDPAMAGLPTTSLRQVHSDIVHVAEPSRIADCRLQIADSGFLHSNPQSAIGDALVTATPGVALAVETADCVPLLLADPENRVVAAVHAGWRGTLRRIAQKTVGVMRREFGADPAKLLAALGPAIHVCCYEVGQDVVEEYRSQFRYADRLFQGLQEENPADVLIPRQVLVDDASFMRPNPASGGRARLDLEEAICCQLLEAGLMAGHIARGAPCTACRTDLFYSYRKEGASAGRLLTEITILPIAECGLKEFPESEIRNPQSNDRMKAPHFLWGQFSHELRPLPPAQAQTLLPRSA